MVRWMCGKKISDRVRLSTMHQEIGISSLETCLRIRRLRWFGHIERQPADTWPNAVRHLVVPGTAPRGRPKKRWQDCVNEDLRALKLKKEDAMERDKWRSLIRKPSRPKASNPQGWGTKDGKSSSEWVSVIIYWSLNRDLVFFGPPCTLSYILHMGHWTRDWMTFGILNLFHLMLEPERNVLEGWD